MTKTTSPPLPLSPSPMPDVQGAADARNVAINKVGVKGIRYPITLKQAGGGDQHTIATINLYVSLPKHKKGTHMSRLLEILNKHHRAMTSAMIVPLLREVRAKLDAADAHIEMEFPYFIEKAAPVTGAKGLMDYVCTFEGTSNSVDDFIMGVRAPATSLCPCSKDISERGAHNQRCAITARVRTKGMLWIEELVKIMESAASAPVYAVLKRPDEKYVTEQAFDNPKFVEDIIRDLAVALNKEDRVLWYSIESENFESIHNHNAYAMIEHDKREMQKPEASSQ
ncbi:MAG: GTP cyclohydrolase FolE2 [Phycisphaerales bacterium]|nr:GTP cyclohydrolase FolE2 [Phycisphaerales bacterium]